MSHCSIGNGTFARGSHLAGDLPSRARCMYVRPMKKSRRRIYGRASDPEGLRHSGADKAGMALSRIHGQRQRTEDTGAVTEIGRDAITIDAVEELAAIDVTAQPVGQARTNERQQARLIHDAAA